VPDVSLTTGLTAFVLGMASYAATNVDNLVILSTLTSDARRRSAAIGGFLAAAAVVLGLSYAATLLEGLLSPDYLGYLGILPLALGLRLAIAGPPGEGERPIGTSAAAIAVLLLANSSDTIAAFAPLLAESSRAARLSLIAGFAVAAAIWLTLMLTVSKRAEVLFRSSARARRFAHRFAATTMIVIGAYILWDTATDTL
jgi:cadmium resistance protein CadD (predicted permease)